MLASLVPALLDFSWPNPSLIVAAVSILVALAAMRSPGRFVSRGHRRDTLKEMQKAYAKSAESRAVVLPAMPAFLVVARDELQAAVEADPSRRPRLAAELRGWPDVSGTGAHEIVANEAKFRSLVGAVKAVRMFTEKPSDERQKLIKAAHKLVGQLNDFGQMIDLSLYSQSDALGQLHRSIAPTCKALEPLIWAESTRGRWGFRLLRLRLRAEHFNDMRVIHSTSALRWQRADEPRTVVFQDPLYTDDYGTHRPTARLEAMSRSERTALIVERIGTRFVPRFGGSRLRRHTRAESTLAGYLRYALEQDLNPLDLTWDMTTIVAGLNAKRRANGNRTDASIA